MLATATAAQDADSLYAKGLLQPGTEAPDFTLPSPDGSRHSLSSLRGSYVVLDFWASWCPDCRKDIPEMKRLHAEWAREECYSDPQKSAAVAEAVRAAEAEQERLTARWEAVEEELAAARKG